MMSRILISGGTVLSQDPGIGVLTPGDVLIEDGKITEVAPKIEPGDEVQVIDASGKFVLPGFIDTHRHMWQGALSNVAFDWNLGEYLWRMLGVVGAQFQPDDVYAGSILSAAQAINAGITTVFDFAHISNSPEHADAAVDALFAGGIRAVYGYGAPCNDAAAWYGESDLRQPEDVRRIAAERFTSREQLVTLGLTARGPELSSLAASIDDLAVGRDLGVVTSLHMGAGLLGKVHGIQQLNEAGVLGPDLLHVHLNTSSDDELKMIADSGGKASVCPRTEMAMGHGYPATGRLLALGVAPTPGMDVVSGVAVNMFDEMRALLEAERARVNGEFLKDWNEVPPLAVKAADVIRLATIDAAAAIGLDSVTGSLTPGKQADLIVVAPSPANLVNEPAASILYSDNSDVHTVLVAGRVVKKDGQVVAFDMAKAMRDAEASRDRIFQRAGVPEGSAPMQITQ
jgi:5-methylthioadenosine/S-adenosylhomocysteine deaminase